MAASARREVLCLYKRLLKLHEALPSDFATLGRRFVQEEFKRHKNASQEQATMFTKEWTEYAVSLESQLSSSSQDGQLDIGKAVSSAEIDLLHDGQIGQLYELQQEIVKLSKSGENVNSTNS